MVPELHGHLQPEDPRPGAVGRGAEGAARGRCFASNNCEEWGRGNESFLGGKPVNNCIIYSSSATQASILQNAVLPLALRQDRLESLVQVQVPGPAPHLPRPDLC